MGRLPRGPGDIAALLIISSLLYTPTAEPPFAFGEIRRLRLHRRASPAGRLRRPLRPTLLIPNDRPPKKRKSVVFLFYFARSCQNATALAAATFRESTPCCIGIRTV